MAIQRLVAINVGAAATFTSHPVHYLVDTTAEMPASGLKLGDTALDKQTNTIYKATSATTWTSVDTTAADTVVRKTAPESVLSSTTPQNDNELLYAMTANHTWAFHLVVSASHAAAATGLRSNFTGPASATWSVLGSSHGGSSSAMVNGGGDYSTVDIPAAGRVTVFDGLVTCGATPGNFQYQWAQTSSHATALIVATNSYLLMKLLV